MFGTPAQTVLVDLDVLLDTRLGTLITLDYGIMGKISPADYRKRKNDRFDLLSPSIDLDKYKKAYSSRDVETLKRSLMTAVLVSISRMFDDIHETTIREGKLVETKLTVNYWPYKLTEEMVEDFSLVIGTYMPDVTKVEMISVHPMIITPSYLSSNFVLYVTYELDKWLNLQQTALVECPIPTITVAAPTLFIDIPPPKELIDEVGLKDAEGSYGFLEYVFAPYVTLALIDVKFFSMVTA